MKKSNRNLKKKEKKSPTDQETKLEPDIGIFGQATSKEGDDDTSLKGFCEAYQSAKNSPKIDNEEDDFVGEGGEEEEKPPPKDDRDGNGHEKPPPSKKQRLAPVQSSSLLLESHPDILGNIYSFLTLKEAVVLRKCCQQLKNDTTIFRCCNILDDTTVSRVQSSNYWQKFRLNRQEKALCNISNSSHFRALLLNKTLPPKILQNYIKLLIQRSVSDNGEAISILLQDGRCKVTPVMLDKALQKDFVGMAAALQQNDSVRASIRMCTTCSVNIGCFKCFMGAKCKTALAIRTPGMKKLPKYCRTCTHANFRFCASGNSSVCQTCLSAFRNRIVADCCGKIACGKGKCRLQACPSCGDRICRQCQGPEAPYCEPCSGEPSYDEYGYGYGNHYNPSSVYGYSDYSR